MRRLAVIVAVVVSPAVAQGDRGATNPWSDGVSEQQQARALALFEAGNVLLEQARFAEALVEYRRAIAQWDHPAIHFNIAKCLLNLYQLVEAYDSIEQSLQYGAAPLEPGVYAEALSYRQRLQGQLAEVYIVCDEDGATVSVDGKYAFKAPGDKTIYLQPGQHQIVATTDAGVSVARTEALVAGRRNIVALEFAPSALVFERRWAAWKPWTAVGVGVALLATGGVLYRSAQRDTDEYNRLVRLDCPCPPGTVSEQAQEYERRAVNKQTVMIGALVVGGTALIVGISMAALNRKRGSDPAGKPKMEFGPMMKMGGGELAPITGISAQYRF